jgi:hypothetical protein
MQIGAPAGARDPPFLPFPVPPFSQSMPIALLSLGKAKTPAELAIVILGFVFPADSRLWGRARPSLPPFLISPQICEKGKGKLNLLYGTLPMGGPPIPCLSLHSFWEGLKRADLAIVFWVLYFCR